MANRKYDYSNEMIQPAETSETSDSISVTATTVEETRRQRLEQRSDALAKEFRSLKPEIARSYNTLCNLVEKSGVLSETIFTMLDLLRTALPLRLTDEDRKALRDGLHAIADNAVSEIRKESERAKNDIRKNDSRVSIPQATFWCMAALLLILSTFFVLVMFANVIICHSGTLTKITVVYAGLIAFTLTTLSYIFYKR